MGSIFFIYCPLVTRNQQMLVWNKIETFFWKITSKRWRLYQNLQSFWNLWKLIMKLYIICWKNLYLKFMNSLFGGSQVFNISIPWYILLILYAYRKKKKIAISKTIFQKLNTRIIFFFLLWSSAIAKLLYNNKIKNRYKSYKYNCKQINR